MKTRTKQHLIAAAIVITTLLDLGSMMYYSYLRPGLDNLENNLMFRIGGYPLAILTTGVLVGVLCYYVYNPKQKHVKTITTVVMMICIGHLFGVLINTASFLNKGDSPRAQEQTRQMTAPMNLTNALLNLAIIGLVIIMPIILYTDSTINVYDTLKEATNEQ